MAKNYHKFELTRKEDPTSVTELMRITQKRAEDLGARARLHIKDGSNYLIVGFSEAFNHLKAGKQLYLVSGEERELKQNPTGAHKRTAAVAQFNQEKIQSRLFPELDPTTLNERAKSLGSFRSLLSQTSITPASSERIFPTEPAQETIRARVIGMSQTGDIKTQRRVLMEAYQEILSSIDGGEMLSEKIDTPEDLIELIDGMKIGEDYDSDINRRAFKGLVENASIYELLKNANQPFLTQLLPHMKNLAGMPESKLAEMLMPTPSELIKPNMRLIIHTPELTIKELADGRNRFQKYKDYWFRKKVNLTEFQDSENETYRQAIMLINKTGSRRNAAQAISEAAAKLMEKVKRPGKIGLELENDSDGNPVAIPWVEIDGELLPRRTGDDKDAEEVAKKLADLETGSHKAVIRIGKSNCFLIAVTNEGMPKNLPNTFDKRWMIPTMHVLADQEQISFVDFLFIVAGRAKSLYDYTLKSEDIKTIFVLFRKLQDLGALLKEEQAELDERERRKSDLIEKIAERKENFEDLEKEAKELDKEAKKVAKKLDEDMDELKKRENLTQVNVEKMKNQRKTLEAQGAEVKKLDRQIEAEKEKIRQLQAEKKVLQAEKKENQKEKKDLKKAFSWLRRLRNTNEDESTNEEMKEVLDAPEAEWWAAMSDEIVKDSEDNDDDDDDKGIFDSLDRGDVKPRIMAPKLKLEDNFHQETIEWLRSKEERSSAPEDTDDWEYLMLELEGDHIVGLGHNEQKTALILSPSIRGADDGEWDNYSPEEGDFEFSKDKGGLKYKFEGTFGEKIPQEFKVKNEGEVKSVALLSSDGKTLDQGDWFRKQAKHDDALEFYNEWKDLVRLNASYGRDDESERGTVKKNPPVIKATSLEKAKDLKEKTLQDHQIEMFIMKKGKSYLLVDKRNINKALQKGYTMAEKTTTGIRSGEDYDPEWKHALARGGTGLSRTLAKAQAETRAKKLNKTVYCEKRTDGKWYVVEAKPKGEHFVIQPNPAEKKYHCALCKRNGKRRVLRKANKAGTKLHCIHCGGKYELHDKR